MSDVEKAIELEEQYDDCQKVKERNEHISKAFKTYEEYYSRLIGLNPTVERIINSDITIIDLYSQADTTEDFYDVIDTDTSIESTDNESD